MAKFSVGDKVLSVKTNDKGVVVKIYDGTRGRQLYLVRYNDGEKNTLESNLLYDTDLTDPFECCKIGLFGSYLDFSRINTAYKITSTTNNTISSLKASKTIFNAYQFKPLLKFLNSTNRRLLIADEVGLGKTIEAGHIMMELAARNNFRNVLVICPSMLKEKWITELKEKFNFNFKIYDNKKHLLDDMKSGIVKGIINYETIRSSEKDGVETNPLIKYISENDFSFDFIICDEAHRLRNRDTKTYKGAEKLMLTATSAVFMTATPIMISEENLFNLLYLLDNQQFNNVDVFNSYLSINKPFITAITRLNNNVNLDDIAKDLKSTELNISYGSDDNLFYRNTTINELFSDYPLYKKIIDNLSSKKDSIDIRVQLQVDLSSMSMMNNIFSRTRKREVITDWTQPVREPHKIIVELYESERIEFDNVIEQYFEDHSYTDEYGDAKLNQGHALGLVQKKRRIASSVYGYLNDISDLNSGIDRYQEYQDAKFDGLLKILEEVVKYNNKKIIVFALFKNTLKYLAIRLKLSGYNSLVIHGDIKGRDEVIFRFKNDNSINILLSSEVGSEGLDMQFCDALVNYDLPWNPMVVEQRIGRIDRFGQKSHKVNIYNLVVKNSIQDDIYERLLERIDIFRNSIGDLEAILDSESDSVKLQKRIINLEKELYCTRLTEYDRKQKIESISKAILIEKQNLEKINEGLTDTLTNDLYFKNEILRIQKNYRYITDVELFKYIQSLISNLLSECSLSDNGNGFYKLGIPLSNKNYLINFLNAYLPQSSETDIELIFRQFINSIRDKTEISITFNQEIAYNNQNVIFLNAYHPVIQAATEFFRKNYVKSNIAFQFGVSIDRFQDVPEINSGDYILGVYVLYFSKKWFGKVQNNEFLVPIVFNIQTNSIIESKDVSERFLGESQLYATANELPTQQNGSIIDFVRYEMAIKIDDIYNEYFNDQEMRINTSKEIQKQQVEVFYQYRLNNLEKNILDIEQKAKNSDTEVERTRYEKVLPAQRGLLKSLIIQKDDELRKISESEIFGKDPKLLTISQIKVF